MHAYKPFVNLGPGDTIREEMAYYNWEQKDLAEIMGFTEKHVSHLLNNKVPIVYETACQLSKIFQQSPQFWLNLDANFRKRLQESAKVKDTEARALLHRYMPIRELRKRIGFPRKVDEMIEAAKAFWKIKELDFAFLEKQAVSFRRSEKGRSFNPYYALTWVQIARNSLETDLPREPYNRTRLENLADTLPDYSVADDGVAKFLEALDACGVVFRHVDHFEKTYADGASFFDDGRPVIVYAARFDRTDNFWFTMAHELGHVILHEMNQGRVFIDSLDDLDLTNTCEREANDFASDKLKSKQILAEFEGVQRPSAARIKTVSQQLGISPGIVAGCLQHNKKASWTSFHHLKPRIRPLLCGCDE